MSTPSRPCSTAERLARALWLDTRIREDAYPTAAALQEEFGVSRRTAMATVAYLRDTLHAPLVYDRSRGGYAYTDRSYGLPSVFLREGELLALLLAEESVRQYLGTPLEEPVRNALARLERFLPAEVSVELLELAALYRISGASGVELPPGLLPDLQRAIRERRPVRIRYYSPHRDAETERVIEPHFFHNAHGDWLVVTWDRLRETDRVFMLARIREWELLEGGFRFRPELHRSVYDLHTFRTDHGTAPQEVVLRFDAYQARWIRERRWHPSQRLEELPGGGLLLRLTVSGEGDLLRWVLGYGAHVEVLAPEGLRERAAAELRRAAGLYGGELGV
ncbi:MAG: WYL domain-containing protein, partial [Armatimonadetes bacterium]|nr:WYL domain-containing protein [Armatimonadota bacterium]